jgi:hypothetical protein
MTRRLILLCVLLVGCACAVGEVEVDIAGDSAAAGAAVRIDGSDRGVLRRADVIEYPRTRDSGRVWEAEDVVVAPGYPAHAYGVGAGPLRLSRRSHVLEFIKGGDTLRVALSPREYNQVRISFLQKTVRARTQDN